MHSKGIAYRDLKPENTLIGENGYPKLIDMGFAKRIHNRRTFSMCGTPDYMAPEIIKRQGHGKGVDFWALGCMIFEMITNTSPFNRGDDPPQVNIVSTEYRAFVRE
jgi:serine/threonine protein kinase